MRSALGDGWRQAGFKVQLSVFKDSARVAGGRVGLIGVDAADEIASEVTTACACLLSL
jgi:hypothetical protein